MPELQLPAEAAAPSRIAPTGIRKVTSVRLVAPAIAATLGTDPSPDLLAGYRLIHDVRRRDWQLWLAAAGGRRLPALAAFGSEKLTPLLSCAA
jgi:hypothetical protein